jgi:hypothetical protein
VSIELSASDHAPFETPGRTALLSQQVTNPGRSEPLLDAPAGASVAPPDHGSNDVLK